MFIVNNPFAEQPLPVYLDHFIFIMTVSVDFRFPLGIIVSIMEPVGTPDRPVFRIAALTRVGWRARHDQRQR